MEKLSQVKHHLPIWPKRPDSSPALCQRHFLRLTHFTLVINDSGHPAYTELYILGCQPTQNVAFGIAAMTFQER